MKLTLKRTEDACPYKEQNLNKTRLRIASNDCTAGRPIHGDLCVAGSIMAMPENEMPLAMWIF